MVFCETMRALTSAFSTDLALNVAIKLLVLVGARGVLNGVVAVSVVAVSAAASKATVGVGSVVFFLTLSWYVNPNPFALSLSLATVASTDLLQAPREARLTQICTDSPVGRVGASMGMSARARRG